MKKLIATMLLTLLTMSMLLGCTSKKTVDTQATTKQSEYIQNEPPVELTILAAASLTDVTKELAETYKKIAPNVTLTFSYGASGALQTQIEEGAPADIFISAATKQMDALEEGGLLLEHTKKELLYNEVVLIAPQDSTLKLTNFEDVGTDKVKIIALGDPESVPVGEYSEEIFTNLGILDTVKTKANYGSDVRQVLTWVEAGEVDCGVVYSTDVSVGEDIKIICEAPVGSHKDIIYPVAVIKTSINQEAAKAFVDFLSTPEAVASFKKYGFTMK